MSRIIAVTGVSKGIGATTFAVNLAARLAAVRHQQVLCLDMGFGKPAALEECLGEPSSQTLCELMARCREHTVAVPLLRGSVPAGPSGVGLLSLAPRPEDMDGVSGEALENFLEMLGGVYEMVMDVPANHPNRLSAWDAAGRVILLFTPTLPSLQAVMDYFEDIKAHKYDLQKFSLVMVHDRMPDSLPEEQVRATLGGLEAHLETVLPHDPYFERIARLQKPRVISSPQAVYFQRLINLIQKVSPETQTSVAGTLAPRLSAPGKAALALPGDAGIIPLATSQERRARWNELKIQLHRSLIEQLNSRRVDMDTRGDKSKEKALRQVVDASLNGLIADLKGIELSREDRLRLVRELLDEALGLGPLEELLRDKSITEIMVNRFDQVYIERSGRLMLSDKRFIDNNHIIQVIRRIIAPLGRRVDESVPMVDARLRDGSRVNAIIPPLSVSGPTLTIRRFPEKALTSEDLIQKNSIIPSIVDFLKICILMRRSIIVSGGTGTGKTTILNLLSGYIPEDERIVTVEDTAELRLLQPHTVRLEARPANIEGQGQVTIRDLVKNSLRMRPDRILVGECRGGEALDMLQAMNTGHEGSMTTIHANSPRDCFTRMETMCLMAGMDLPVWAIRDQIKSAVHILVQLTRMQDGSRKITRITEVTGRDNDTILTQDLFTFIQESVDDSGAVKGFHTATGKIPLFYPDLESRGMKLDPAIFIPDARYRAGALPKEAA